MTLNRLCPLLCAWGVFAAACGGSEFGAADETIAKDDGATSQGGGSDGNETDGASASNGGSTSGSSGGRATGSSPGSGGARNTGGGASTGGAPSGDGGTVSTDGGTGTSGTPSIDASTDGPVGAGGALGAGGDPNGAGGACQSPPTWFPDDDQDGYGRSTGTVVACEPPSNGHWANVGADCNDDDDRVHPNQTTYFTDVYSTPGGGGSFDYNCAGGEQGNPDQGGAVVCAGLPPLVPCTGSGWVPTSRGGAGQNPLCGSFTRATCQNRQLVCVPIAFQVTDGYGCK